MLRKTVGGIASTALVAGLATAGIVVASPASAAVPSPAPNPTLQGCGIPLTLVLDASSRIGPLRLAIATALSEDGLSLRGLLPRMT